MEEDSAFVDCEEGAGGLDFFEDDVAVVGCVDYGEMLVFRVADRDAARGLGAEALVAVVEAHGVFYKAGRSEERGVVAEVDACLLLGGWASRRLRIGCGLRG